MRSYIWFVCGMYLAALAAFALSACAFDGSGAGAEAGLDLPSSVTMVHIRPYNPPRMFLEGMVVESIPSAESMQIALAGTRAQVAAYRVSNHDNVLHEVTHLNMCATNAPAVQSFQYSWDDGALSPSHPFPEEDGCASFVGMHAQISAHASRVLKLFVNFAPISLDASEAPRSGEPVVTELAALFDEHAVEVPLISGEAERFVLRRARPEIATSLISTGGIQTGVQSLYQWNVHAASGSLAVKQFALHLELDAATLCSFHLKRNDHFVESAEYGVYGVAPQSLDLVDLKEHCATSDMTVFVTFANEQRLNAGEDAFYALGANVDSLDSFARILLRFNEERMSATSTLSCERAPLAELAGAPAHVPAIIWSDVSEGSHRASLCDSSGDWIGDAQITNLSSIQEFD